MSLPQLQHPGYTLEDWKTWAGHWELIHGVAYPTYGMTPAPSLEHQRVSRRLERAIEDALEEGKRKSRGGECEMFHAPLDVFLSEINVYQPDVIFISNQRRSILTEHGLEGAPDLAVEVLSPGTARFDKGSKRKVYARTGVKELWLVDVEAKLIHVYQLTKDAETPAATYDEKSVFTSPLLPGLRLKAALIFKSPLRR